jgi:hypothetical protein
MKLPKSWHRVTPFSKMLALSMFIVLPFLGLYLGYWYRGKIDLSNGRDTCEQARYMRLSH